MKGSLSLNRIWLLVKYEYMGNLTSHLRQFYATVLALLIPMLFLQFQHLSYKWFLNNVNTLYDIVFVLLMAWAASRHMAFLSNKNNCISYLMLPASKVEKFITRTLIVFSVIIIEFAVAICCAEAIRQIVTFVAQCPAEYHSNTLIDYIQKPIVENKSIVNVGVNDAHYSFDIANLENEAMTAVALLSFWIVSIYILCSNIWNKHALFAGITTCLLLDFITGFIFVFFLRTYFDEHDPDISKVEAQRIVLDIVWEYILYLSLITAALGVINLFIAYYFFTRKQIKNRFFSFNIKTLFK